MKKTYLFTLCCFAVITLLIANVNIAFNGLNLYQKSITALETPIAGSDWLYEVCARDDCSISVGVEPIIYTYYGHYSHCVNGPGLCISGFNTCPPECDAM